MTTLEIVQKFVKLHHIDPIENMGGDGGCITPFSEVELMQLANLLDGNSKQESIAFLRWASDDKCDFICAYEAEPKFIKDSENNSEIRYTTEFVYDEYIKLNP